MKANTRFIKTFAVLLIAALLLTAVPAAAAVAQVPEPWPQVWFVGSGSMLGGGGDGDMLTVGDNADGSGTSSINGEFTATTLTGDFADGIYNVVADLEFDDDQGDLPEYEKEQHFAGTISIDSENSENVVTLKGTLDPGFDTGTDLDTDTHDILSVSADFTDGVGAVAIETTIEYGDGTIVNWTVTGNALADIPIEWYQTGDHPVVAVYDPDVETNRVQVALYSYLTGHFTNIWAYEDPEFPGLFEGTLTLVDTLSGINQLLVQDGDTIGASYYLVEPNEWILDEAQVDDTKPIISEFLPEDEDLVTFSDPEIAASLFDGGSGIDVETAVMTVDGEVVVADVTETSISYQPVEEEDYLSEGLHIVTVDVSDVIGNAADTASWSFTVDTKAPSIKNQKATPPAVMPNEQKTIVFTAEVSDMTSGVDTVKINLSSIGGSANQAMLDDGEDFDETAGDGIYTAAHTTTFYSEGNRNLTITVKDEAGNSGIGSITLRVWFDIVPPVITDTAIQYPPYGLSSARPDDGVVISAKVTDNVAVESVVATAKFDHDDNPDTIDFIVIETELLDNGEDLDETEGDGIYTGVATVDIETPKGSYPITITATDDKENEATDESLTLVVDPNTTGYVIDLVEGWNLISLPLIPNDPAIEAFLSELIANESVIQVVAWPYDEEQGKIVENRWAPPALEGITEMVDGVGYWVEMSEADELTFTGKYLPEPPAVLPSYIVHSGWNLIGYLSMHNAEAKDYLGEAGVGNMRAMYDFNESTGLYEQITLTEDLEPGNGYWLAVSVDATIYPYGESNHVGEF